MSLFGRGEKPAGKRFIATCRDDAVELWWNDEHELDGTWRLLRSGDGFADGPLAAGSIVIADGAATHAWDRDIRQGQKCFYSLFLLDGSGVWTRRATRKVTIRRRPRWWPRKRPTSMTAEEGTRRARETGAILGHPNDWWGPG
jgi:hypothetical protein